jgi:hypothetical protein
MLPALFGHPKNQGIQARLPHSAPTGVRTEAVFLDIMDVSRGGNMKIDKSTTILFNCLLVLLIMILLKLLLLSPNSARADLNKKYVILQAVDAKVSTLRGVFSQIQDEGCEFVCFHPTNPAIMIFKKPQLPTGYCLTSGK